MGWNTDMNEEFSERAMRECLPEIREKMISEFEKWLETYGPDWINKETCKSIIDDLKNEKPVHLGYPWTEVLDGVLRDMGYNDREASEVIKLLGRCH